MATTVEPSSGCGTFQGYDRGRQPTGLKNRHRSVSATRPDRPKTKTMTLGILVRRICNFTIKAISVSDQNQASGSISSCTTRINLPALSRYKRHAARFDLLRDHRAGLTRSSLRMAPLGYAVECGEVLWRSRLGAGNDDLIVQVA